jgi:uncharacterized protein with PIN domain
MNLNTENTLYGIVQQNTVNNENPILQYAGSTLIGPYLSLLGCEQCKYYYWTGADWEGIYLDSQVTTFFT